MNLFRKLNEVYDGYHGYYDDGIFIGIREVVESGQQQGAVAWALGRYFAPQPIIFLNFLMLDKYNFFKCST